MRPRSSSTTDNAVALRRTRSRVLGTMRSMADRLTVGNPLVAASGPDRFWAKVNKTQGCWLWTASTFGNGRGQYRVGSKMQQAHRVAWELTYGSPPAGLLRTDCGNLRCVRPDHQALVDHKVGPNNRARTPVRRFEAMVNEGPACWTWLGSRDRLGYGQFGVMAPGEPRRMVRAHRFAWEQAHGAIPVGVDILHLCGNRACVRPDHLGLRGRDEWRTRTTPPPTRAQALG